jgi:hypothetical protein
MDNDIKPVPAFAEVFKQGIDLIITTDITRQHNIGVALLCHLRDTHTHFLVRVAERQFGAFPLHGLCNTPGNRPVAGQPDNQCAFSAQESHSYTLM